MEINFEKKNREFIDPDKVNKYVQEFLALLQSWLEHAGEIITREYIPLAEKWVKAGKDVLSTPCIELQRELLTKDEFISIVKENKVVGCDSNVAYKKMNKDGSFQIVVTFLKGEEFLPADRNINIFINCEGLSKDMKELFNENDLIIMK